MKPREGVVRGLGNEGDGAVLLADGSIVLARGVLPGERVRIDEIGQGRTRRARRVEVLAASPDRVAPPCAYASTCGGCSLMHASEALSARTKLERVQRAIGRLAEGVEITLDTPAQRLGYRRRARLAFAHEGGVTQLGYRADASRSVVDVARCLVLAPVLETLVTTLRARVAPHLAGSGELRLGAIGERGTARIESRDPQPPALYGVLEALVREELVAGIALLAGGATAAATWGAHHEETVDAEGRTLRSPLGGFGQAHAEHNRTLAAYVLDAAAADGARVLELYAGHGNFTLSLATRADRLTAVELDITAAAALRANLETHGLRAEVVARTAVDATHATPRGTIDVALLDPPREGARDLVAPLVALGPARIAYVSCSPESLARDAEMLLAGGYRITQARAFDMFPQTAHVEVVARFERAGVAARPSRR